MDPRLESVAMLAVEHAGVLDCRRAEKLRLKAGELPCLLQIRVDLFVPAIGIPDDDHDREDEKGERNDFQHDFSPLLNRRLKKQYNNAS